MRTQSPCSKPAERMSVPPWTRSMSPRPAAWIALSLPGSSGAGAFVKLNFSTASGGLVLYFSMASCSRASAPPTSVTLIVAGVFGAVAAVLSPAGEGFVLEQPHSMPKGRAIRPTPRIEHHADGHDEAP